MKEKHLKLFEVRDLLFKVIIGWSSFQFFDFLNILLIELRNKIENSKVNWIVRM